MESFKAFLGANRLPIIIALSTLVVAVLGLSFLAGLASTFTIGLFLAVVGVAIGIYRLLDKTPITWTEPLKRGRLTTSAFVGLIVVGLAIQAVPYGRDHTNPPITGEPAWDSPVTRDLAVRACFDCHSNEVEYPWYSQIAPVSWAVQSHIDSGRSKVNYSEWDQPQKDADESAETVIDGEMPPAYYTRFTDADARLTETERRQLIDGLIATFGGEDDGADDD
ncbi:MAG: heme-binding domain-containing protein [Acidimicrobiia bacterium]